MENIIRNDDEVDYNDSGCLETLYLLSDPRVKAELLEAMNTPLEECIPAEEVEW